MSPDKRLRAEFGYGLAGRGNSDRLWYPYVGAQAEGGAGGMLTLGLRLRSGPELQAAVEVGRRDNGREPPEHALQLRGSYRWGRGGNNDAARPHGMNRERRRAVWRATLEFDGRVRENEATRVLILIDALQPTRAHHVPVIVKISGAGSLHPSSRLERDSERANSGLVNLDHVAALAPPDTLREITAPDAAKKP